MRAACVFGVLCVLTALIHFECAGDEVKSSSEEIARFVKEGNVEAVKEIYKRQKIRNDKYAYVCACSQLREANRRQFRKIGSKMQLRALPAIQKWVKYTQIAEEPPFEVLRQLLKGNASEYVQFGISMCRIYSICEDHMIGTNNTVIVNLSAFENTTETIVDVLRRERLDNLIKEEDMTYVNLLNQAFGMRNVPYATFNRTDSSTTFAIPMVKDFSRCNKVEAN